LTYTTLGGTYNCHIAGHSMALNGRFAHLFSFLFYYMSSLLPPITDWYQIHTIKKVVPKTLDSMANNFKHNR
jgi:hypothetical protein